MPLLHSIARGEFSLGFVVLSSFFFFGIVCVLFIYIMTFRVYHNARIRYRKRRKALYEPGIEKVLSEAALSDIVEAFRPRRWGDAEISQEVMTEAMRHLTGPPFETLRLAAGKLGFIEQNLKWLYARDKHRRGRAMEALGLMRSEQAIVGIIDILEHQPLDMKLVALRALAAIKDPVVLPYFIKTSDLLPPAMMVRLASLMLEFGPPCREKILQLINRHPTAFPPRILADLIREAATSLETPAR